MHRNLYLIILFVFAVSIVCKRIPTLPETEPEPGSRNYIWELDTLNSPMNYFNSIWGASPNDVWAVGGAGTYKDRLWHFNGNEWSVYNKEAINVCGVTLWGTGPNNVWMGGQGGWGVGGGAIWHYNGDKWEQYYHCQIENAYSIEVRDIWGIASNNVYACGTISFFDGTNEKWRGFVLHFDGKEWRQVVQASFNSQFMKIRKNDNSVIVQSYAIDKESSAKDVITFYQIKNNDLDEIYSTTRENIDWASLHVIDGITYFVIGEDIYSFSSGNIEKQFTIPFEEFECQIFGRTKLDIFVSMKDGIAHYNGEDIEYLYYYPGERMSEVNDPLIFKNEVFFVVLNFNGNVNETNLILHGKILK